MGDAWGDKERLDFLQDEVTKKEGLLRSLELHMAMSRSGSLRDAIDSMAGVQKKESLKRDLYNYRH